MACTSCASPEAWPDPVPSSLSAYTTPRRVASRHIRSLTCVSLDRLLLRERETVMHQSVARTQRPERCGSADVVQQKSLYGWIPFVARAGTRGRATIVHFARGFSPERTRVERLAALAAKMHAPSRTEAVMGPRAGACVARMNSANARMSTPSSSGSATRSKGVPNLTQRPRGVLIRKERAGDSHFVQIGVRCE